MINIIKEEIEIDESSPHLHIVGIAVKENCKTGMSKQVGKCCVFTKDNLPKIQDKMRDKFNFIMTHDLPLLYINPKTILYHHGIG